MQSTALRLTFALLIGDAALQAQSPEEIPPFSPATGDAVVNGEWFIGADPGLGKGNSIPVENGKASFDVLTTELPVGSHQLYVRFQDNLGAWSFPELSPVVVLPVIQADAVEWRITEEGKPLMNGRHSIDSPEYPSSIEIQSDPITAESTEHEFIFEARLLLEGEAPTPWGQHAFQVQETPLDQDSDGDGLLDRVETGTGTYASIEDTGTDPLNRDTDGDGISDGVEAGSPLDPNHDDTALIQFFAERTRQLNLPAPLITRDANGHLQLRLRLEASDDLSEWFQLVIGEPTISVDDGEIVLELPQPEAGAQFYLIRPRAPEE